MPLISPIGAPEARSAWVSACFSAKVIPAAGWISSAEPPPEIRARTKSSLAAGRQQLQHPRGGGNTRGVGHRMRRLDDLDALARPRIAIARDHEPLAGAPFGLHRLGHARAGLSGTDDDDPPGRLRGADDGRDRASDRRRRRRHRTWRAEAFRVSLNLSPAGRAHCQLDRCAPFGRRPCAIVQPIEQGARRVAREPRDVTRHRRQARPRKRCLFDVVEADDADVMPDANPIALQARQSAQAPPDR
jgi:hypothetical protein